jgi:hypothetical protein
MVVGAGQLHTQFHGSYPGGRLPTTADARALKRFHLKAVTHTKNFLHRLVTEPGWVLLGVARCGVTSETPSSRTAPIVRVCCATNHTTWFSRSSRSTPSLGRWTTVGSESRALVYDTLLTAFPHLLGAGLERGTRPDIGVNSLRENLATRSLQELRSCLSRSVRRAMMRGLVDRNVVELCQVPRGRPGRPSKSLTVAQVRDVLVLTTRDPMHCYIVVSLLTGARTEELRRCVGSPGIWIRQSIHRCHHTSRSGVQSGLAAIPRLVARVALWRCQPSPSPPFGDIEWRRPSNACGEGGVLRAGLGLRDVVGTCPGRANVRRDFRRALTAVPSVVPAEWTPREMRHSRSCRSSRRVA